MADKPSYEEFCVARHLANTRDDDVGGRAYQVCRWYRGSMFIRQEAEIALAHIRDTANRPDGTLASGTAAGSTRSEFVEFTKPELQIIKSALADLARQVRLNEVDLLAAKITRATGECERYERLEAELPAEHS